jgi:hypothetical protein
VYSSSQEILIAVISASIIWCLMVHALLLDLLDFVFGKVDLLACWKAISQNIGAMIYME